MIGSLHWWDVAFLIGVTGLLFSLGMIILNIVAQAFRSSATGAILLIVFILAVAFIVLGA